MKKIIAKLKLYEGENKRQVPFKSGYRPTFGFVKESRTSGQIILINQTEFKPGTEAIVKIEFHSENYLGDSFSVNTKFFFYEGKEPLGEGVVIDLLV